MKKATQKAVSDLAFYDNNFSSFVVRAHKSERFDPSMLPYCTPSIKKSYNAYIKNYVPMSEKQHSLVHRSTMETLGSYFNTVGKVLYESIEKTAR